jgi:hypothetical protein
MAIQFAGEVTANPAAALSAIDRLKTLQQLLIEAGHEFGWRRTWVVVMQPCVLVSTIASAEEIGFESRYLLR